MSEGSPKIEFFTGNGIIEIRYFDTLKDELYRSWKLPESIVNELITWWISLRKNKEITCPLQERTKVCEFTMHTGKNIEIKSLDSKGRTNMTGWSLPAAAVDRLVIWQKGAANR